MAKNDKVIEGAFGCIAALLASIAGFARWAVEAWSVSVLWGWFVVPLGVPAIGILPAFGVLSIASIASHGGLADAAAHNDAIDKAREKCGCSYGTAALLLSAMRLALSPCVVGLCWVLRALFA